MNEETLKTFSKCSFFVSLFGALGFLIAIVLNVLRVFIEASTSEVYETWVKTQMLSITYLIRYLLISILFAGLGLLIIGRFIKNLDG